MKTKRIKSILLILILCIVSMGNAFSFCDELKFQTVSASSIKTIDALLKKGAGPFLITGTLNIGRSDGDEVTDGIFTYARHLKSRGFVKPGTFFFGILGTPKMQSKGSYLVSYELGLYQHGKLMRTIWSDQPLTMLKYTSILVDTPLVEYDTVKYKCKLYSAAQLALVPKGYEVERWKLPQDADKLSSTMEKTYAYTYFRWSKTDGDACKEYSGLHLNEDRYADADGKIIYPKLQISTVGKYEEFSFRKVDNSYCSVNSMSSNEKDDDGNALSIDTCFNAGNKDLVEELRLYQKTDTGRGYQLYKVILVTGQPASEGEE